MDAARTAACLALLLAGCGTQQPTTVAQTDDRLTASGTVLESPGRGPRLCAGVEESYPPQCGGLPLVGWDWATADGEESSNGTTWGEYAVVGRYDGRSLTLTGPPAPPVRPDEVEDPVDTPCPTPPGGWRSTGASPSDEQARGVTIATARRRPDHAGAWVDDEDGTEVLTLAFTGDLDRHRADAARTWGGALCLVEHERTLAALTAAQDALTAGAAQELGLTTTYSAALEVENVVELGVWAADDQDQAALDARFGAGTVVLRPALTPVT